MVLDIDVFGPGVGDWIVGQSYRSLVVAFQWDDDLFLSPPTRCVKVVDAVLDGVSAQVLFEDLDQSVLLVWLEESQFCEQQSEPRCLFCGQSQSYILCFGQ